MPPNRDKSAIIALTGREGTGKTGLAMSACLLKKGLCGYIEMDRAPKGEYINDLLDTGRIYRPKFKYKNPGKKFDKTFAEKGWDELESLTLELLKDPAFYSVIWDTGTYGWELARMAEFGKLTQVMPHHYGPLNTLFSGIMYSAETYGKILIVLHTMAKEYKEGKDKKEVWTGYYRQAGFSHMDFVANIRLETHKTEDNQFACHVTQNKINPKMDRMDLVGEEMTMASVLQSTWGGVLDDYVDV